MNWEVRTWLSEFLGGSLSIACTRSVRRSRGFTLVELLISFAVIALLAAMLAPILPLASRLAKASATRSVMAKADVALRLFRSDIGSYPYQVGYADLSASPEDAPNWTNRLYRHLGTAISRTDMADVRADADAAAALYDFTAQWYEPSNKIIAYAYSSAFTFRGPDFRGDGYFDPGTTMMLNRMAAERARLAIWSGNAEISAPVVPSARFKGRGRLSMPTGQLLGSPKSAARPGWANDYLHGEMDRRFVREEALHDAWGRPLLYVCRVIEGTVGSYHARLMGDTTGALRAIDFGLQKIGRTSLAPFDAITGVTLVADALYLPDTGNLQHSDRRRYAASGYEAEFELWSAGPDGMANWMRDASVNIDNVSLNKYDASIGR